MEKPDYSKNYLSTSAFAKSLNVRGQDLFSFLLEKGFLEKFNDNLNLTYMGEKIGGKMGSLGGPSKFPIWPKELINDKIFESIRTYDSSSENQGNPLAFNKDELKPKVMIEENTPKWILKKTFGYQNFHGNQEAIISDVISGKDAFVLMPTGGGKSICYQIPAIIRDGVGIIVSPLIALMQDQVEGLKQFGIRADFINSTLTLDEVKLVEKKIIENDIDLLYVAPERLMMPSFLKMLVHIKLALFAIDEAHCVSQWGHDFRPNYLQLSMLHEKFPSIPRLALTATADPTTRKEIIEKLKLESAQEYISSFDRPNISYRILLKQNPKKQLEHFIESEHPNSSGIVYCMSRKKVETTADWLKKKGYYALPYHAGMDKKTRYENQRRFLHNEGIIIVATVAFGMGIDKPNVRFVAHLDLPKNIESYYQETGRAGRNGEPSDAVLFYGLTDIATNYRMIESSSSDDRFKHVQIQKLQAMLGLCESAGCRRKILLGYLGESYEKGCQNCDNCISKPETWDGSITAQKALSCVCRTGERFGVKHLVNVLLGKQERKIFNFGHDKVSTYGIGTELNEIEWSSVFRQLLAAGYIRSEMDLFGGFRLTKKGVSFLKLKEQIFFRKDPISNIKKSKRLKQYKPLKEFQTKKEGDLFESLRTLRSEIAKEINLPAYCVFHDKTLYKMVEEMPQNINDMEKVHGIGGTKLYKYGQSFLNVILQNSKGLHLKDEGITKIQNFSLNIDEFAEKKIDSTTDQILISENIKKKILELPITKSNDQISDIRILELRKTSPRAYEPWSSDEDSLLNQVFKENNDINDLSTLFQRQPGAIRSRIKKLSEISLSKKSWKKIKKDKVLILLKENDLTSSEIADRVGVSPQTVWAYKAHFTMGTYGSGKEINDDDKKILAKNYINQNHDHEIKTQSKAKIDSKHLKLNQNLIGEKIESGSLKGIIVENLTSTLNVRTKLGNIVNIPNGENVKIIGSDE